MCFPRALALALSALSQAFHSLFTCFLSSLRFFLTYMLSSFLLSHTHLHTRTHIAQPLCPGMRPGRHCTCCCHGNTAFKTSSGDEETGEHRPSPPKQARTAAALSSPSANDSEEGLTLVTFDKHKGKTFAQVQRQDPSYCRWVCGLEDPSFLDFLQKERASDAQAASPREGCTSVQLETACVCRQGRGK